MKKPPTSGRAAILAFGVLEAEDDSPHPRVFWLRVGDDLAVSLAGDVVE